MRANELMTASKRSTLTSKPAKAKSDASEQLPQDVLLALARGGDGDGEAAEASALKRQLARVEEELSEDEGEDSAPPSSGNGSGVQH